MTQTRTANRAYFLVNHAEDGEHISRIVGALPALHELAMELGREACTLRVGRRYTDDWGRQMRLERAGTATLRDRKGYGRAYDARECGVETRAQRALLERMEGGAA